MGHEYSSGFQAFTPAWHGLGNTLDNPANAAEAMQQGGLSWTVSLYPITVGGIVIENNYATVRDDNHKVLGIVGNKYHVVQNQDLFTFFDPVIDRNKHIYHTGGVLKEGRVVWLLAKLDRSFYVVDDDRVDSYVLLASSHDGTMNVTLKHTPIRVVCWNTLSAALVGNHSMVQIRHTRSAEAELRLAHKVMGLTTKSMDQMRELAETLLSKSISGRFLKQFVETVFPSQRDKEKRPTNRHLEPIEMLFESETNMLPGMQHSGWAAYNSVTAYIDHIWRSKDPLYRTWFGNGEDVRSRAIKMLVDQ